MNILILGASGFIGQRIAAALRARGHTLTTPNRHEVNYLSLDKQRLMPLLVGQEVVINAIGVMHRHEHILEQIHHHAPAAIAACAREVGVPRFLQLSALGADVDYPVAFLGSKGRGDTALCESGLAVNIVRPSLVYGRGGSSTEMFLKLLRLPILALPAGGAFLLQPVHVAEVAEGIANLAENPRESGTIINMSGAAVHTLAEYLGILRQTVHGKKAPLILPIPLAALRPLLPLTNWLSNGLLGAGNIRILQQGSTADCHDFAQLLGRMPLGAAAFAGKE
ncbi:MAG: NAD-dependent epimerase/dehydratase family protein [Cardiobacteriaceae bacterium]|nr:NAD-dependent epimerase/dehydratase family protein [Cardiobacteriaceae bacterium]